MQKEFIKHIAPFLNSYKKLDPVPTGVVTEITKLSNIKCIIFDIYGTLIVSASGDLDKSNVSTKNLTTALNAAGLKWRNDSFEGVYGDQVLNDFHTAVEDQHAELKLKGHLYPEVDIISVWEKCLQKAISNNWLEIQERVDIKTLTVVFEILSNPVWPMPGMRKIIDELVKLKIPIGIVSNAQFYTPIIMNNFISDYVTEQENINPFDHDISVYSYKLLRSKPDTYLFEQLSIQLKNKYNVLPMQALFVGNDMLKDVWTAKQVGFKTALFAGDKRSLRMRETDERCSGLKPDVVINDLLELLDVIDL